MINVKRHDRNPIISPETVKPLFQGYEVLGAFNAAIAKMGEETIMLLRVAETPSNTEVGIVKVPIWDVLNNKLTVLNLDRGNSRYDFSDPRVVREHGKPGFAYLTSLSYLRIARSRNGVDFTVDEEAFLLPTGDLESFGIEDPRITQIADEYYVVFTQVSPAGVGVGMVSTRDFQSCEHHGMIFAPDNKDVVIFPEKINGKYYALHRPSPKSIGKPEIWIAESDNLKYWGNHRLLFGIREGFWDGARIGGGTVPIKTDKGWLELYHGANAERRYCMGAILLDLNDPSKVLARTHGPVLEPGADYEVNGFFGNVVFACGSLVEGDKVKMYYGVSDESMAYAELSLKEIMNALVEV